jgi:hypothetical protein
MELIKDILSDANKDITSLKKYSSNSVVRPVFEHAFLTEKKFILPDGIPPYKAQLGSSEQLTGSFYMETRRFYVYCRSDLKPLKRETMFISCLESLSNEEAKILIAIKEQKLDSLFPNITLEKLRGIGFLK